jgi:hypothetical protein
MTDKVPNEALVSAGISLMSQLGQTLERLPTQTRAMVYALPNGKTVRIRTCNDHILVVLADSPKLDAKLNIEGTDHLLIVMPEAPRTFGPVIGYFVPTEVAVEAVRRSHAEWLASAPATAGNNRTWNLWFNNGKAGHEGFATRWQQYRLPGLASTAQQQPISTARLKSDPREAALPAKAKSLGDVIGEARRQIAEAAGIPIDAVKITVNLVV